MRANQFMMSLAVSMALAINNSPATETTPVNVDGDTVGVPLKIPAKQAEREWAFLQGIVPSYNRVWNETEITILGSDFTVYAPVLGNGRLVGCLSGGGGFVSHYLRTTDFWTDGVREIPAAKLRVSEASSLADSHAKVWASSKLSDNQSAELALDGALDTQWCTSGATPQWLAVDMGRACTISRWVVRHCGASGQARICDTSDFKLQRSDDGENWTDVDAVAGNTLDVTDRNVPAFKCRYARLFITKPTNDTGDKCARIPEFELFSEPAAATESPAVAYRQQEDMLNAVVRSDVPVSGGRLEMISYIAATENTLITKVTNRTPKPTRIKAQLSDDVMDRSDFPAKVMIDGDVLGYTRETSSRNDARWVSRLGFALRVFGGSDVKLATNDATRGTATFEIPAGATATIITCVSGGRNAVNPLDKAVARVRELNEGAIAALEEAHKRWWRDDWWLRSFVRTYDDKLDAYYYRMLYQLGTMCREGGLNSGLQGAWKTSDNHVGWPSYCLNDLGAARYYIPLMMANRPATARMWIQTMYDWMPEGRRRAEGEGLKGISCPVHIGPWGSMSSETTHGQKFLATNASIIGDWYYDLTGDKEYLGSHVYPFMKACAEFYESWLKLEADGKYHIKGASYEDRTDNVWNSCLDLALARVLFTDIVKYSDVLGVDAERRTKWAHIRDNLNDFTTATYKGKTVFMADTERPFNYSGNVLQTQIIYPGYTCNRFSDPKTLEIGFNTMSGAAEVGGWTQDNMVGQGFYGAMQRIGGFDVAQLIKHFKEMIEEPRLPYKKPYILVPLFMGGASAWDFNQQLCVQSYKEGFLFFPDYPKNSRAVFERIRMPGAFLASGEFAEGQARNLSLFSELGGPCTVISPWGPDAVVRVADNDGHDVPTRCHDGDRYTFETRAGMTYLMDIQHE